jgi:hypothetical protein
MSRPVTRRNFLRGAGGIAVGLPFLESMSPAHAGGQGPNLRYLQFMHVQGTLVGEWAPSGGNGPQLSNILSPLEAVKDRMTFLSNVDNPSANDYGVNGHVNSGRTIFTCAPNSGNNDLPDGPSVDQVIADRLAAPTPYKSLQFGIGGSGIGEYQALMAGPQDPVPLDGDPVAVFDQLFADLDSDPLAAPTTMQRLRSRRQSVLDVVKASFDSTRASVSVADRMTLDNHADKIRQLEQQLANTGEATVSCATPTIDLPAGYDANDANHDDSSSRVFIDLMVMALACDMTRVGTLQYTNYHSPNYPWLGAGVPGAFPEWHSMVHEIPNLVDVAPVRAVYRWYMEELAYLVEQLSLVQDADGSMLDNMLVLSTSELSNGATHSTSGLPIVLAGGVGGQLTTNRHVDMGGARLGEVYTTFIQMFGGDDQVFGNPAYCNGPVTI